MLGETRIQKRTYQVVCQLGNALKKEPHPFAHRLGVNGTPRPANGGASRARINLQKIYRPEQMLRLALLGAKAALLQHVPHHAGNFKPHSEEGAKAAVLHCRHSNPLSCLVHDLPSGTMESGILRLFIVAPLIAAPVVVVIVVLVACVVIIVVDGDVTHLCVLGESLALIDGSGGRNGRGSGQTHLHAM